MNKETGGPAFPFSLHIGGKAGLVDAEECGAGGMSLRDYFAAKALQGMIAAGLKGDWGNLAVGAYAAADAMLEARK